MSEKAIVNKIMARLEKQGFFVVKIHGGPYQKAGLPDLLAVRDGRTYAFEVKKPGGKATALQVKRLEELRAAGAVVAVVSSVEELDQYVGRS